jgi:hypothetical protein
MVRGIIGVVVGAIVWMAAFMALAFGLGALWHGYALHGRDWFRDGVFTFTPLMACLNLLFWALAAVIAGWVAMKVARREPAVWVLAAILVLFLASQHLVLYWSRFPWWYNLGVVIPCGLAVLWGGRLAEESARGSVRLIATV